MKRRSLPAGGTPAWRTFAPAEMDRRGFIRSSTATFAAIILGTTAEPADAEQSRRIGATMKKIKAGLLEVNYLESGNAEGSPVVLLHGFPYDVHSYDEAAEQLVSAGHRVLVPYLRGFGPTRFLSEDSPRVGQQAALGEDLLAFLDALKIQSTIVAGFDWGGRAACVVAALHPDRVSGLVSCGTGYNLQNSSEALKPIDPAMERSHWYWFYLNSERGKAALTQNRVSFCRYLWQNFSPTWHFDDATFARTAPSFDNPDFLRVVLPLLPLPHWCGRGRSKVAIYRGIAFPTAGHYGSNDCGLKARLTPLIRHRTRIKRRRTFPRSVGSRHSIRWVTICHKKRPLQSLTPCLSWRLKGKLAK